MVDKHSEFLLYPEHVNYSELLQLAKGWSNLVSNRIIIWRLPDKVHEQSEEADEQMAIS